MTTRQGCWRVVAKWSKNFVFPVRTINPIYFARASIGRVPCLAAEGKEASRRAKRPLEFSDAGRTGLPRSPAESSERLDEYEIAFIVRRNSAQLHGNRKLLVVKRRKTVNGTGAEGGKEEEEERRLTRAALAIPCESPARRAATSM